MNLIHYWNSTATILLGEVFHWRQIVKVYAEKKLCVKFRTLSVQIIWNVWADNRYHIILRLLSNKIFIICSWLFFNRNIFSIQMCGHDYRVCIWHLYIIKLIFIISSCVQLYKCNVGRLWSSLTAHDVPHICIILYGTTSCTPTSCVYRKLLKTIRGRGNMSAIFNYDYKLILNCNTIWSLYSRFVILQWLRYLSYV